MQTEYWILVVFSVAFVGMWVFVTGLIAWMGGWWRLAKSYRDLDAYQGKKLRMKSGWLGVISCRNAPVPGANMQGMYMAVNPFFAIWHPLLFIPWGDIQTEERDGIFMSFTTFKFAQVPNGRLTISSKLMARVQELKTGDLFFFVG